MVRFCCSSRDLSVDSTNSRMESIHFCRLIVFAGGNSIGWSLDCTMQWGKWSKRNQISNTKRSIWPGFMTISSLAHHMTANSFFFSGLRASCILFMFRLQQPEWRDYSFSMGLCSIHRRVKIENLHFFHSLYHPQQLVAAAFIHFDQFKFKWVQQIDDAFHFIHSTACVCLCFLPAARCNCNRTI